MSENPEQSPDQPEPTGESQTESAAPEKQPAEMQAAEGQAPEEHPAAGQPAQGGAEKKDAAVDTGRRIDPSKLQVSGGKGRGQVRLRKKGERLARGKDNKGDKPEGAQKKPAEGAEAGSAEAQAQPAKPSKPSKPKKAVPKRRVVEADELYAGKDGRGPRKGKGKGPGRRGPPGPQAGRGAGQMPPVSKGNIDDAGGMSFADMLAESGAPDRVLFSVGDRVQGEVVHIGTDSVFLSLGPGTEATLGLAEVLDENGEVTVAPGDKVNAYVTRAGEIVELSLKLGRHGFDPALLMEAKDSGIPVEGQVTGHNKGGLEVSLMGARGFCPLGQADLGYVEDPGSFVGKTLAFVVTEVKGKGREVVLSRRLLLERERAEKREQTLAELEVGQRRHGTVTRLQPFGAFVDLGGVDGLVPVSEMSFARVNDPSEVVGVGDLVEVEVTKIEDDPKRAGEKRIGLSLKHAAKDPFDVYADRLVAGGNVSGRVTKLKPFGAFVELFEAGSGLEGLVHISEVADRRIGTPAEVLDAGQEVTVRILDVDPGQRRISLSIKEAELPERAPGERAQKAAARAGWRRGLEVIGVVDRIERYGVFVQVEGLGSALLPASESGVPRGGDLGKALPLGTELELLVIDVDDRGRAKVSRKAREQKEERELVKSYGGKAEGGGLGTLGDLLKHKLGQ